VQLHLLESALKSREVLAANPGAALTGSGVTDDDRLGPAKGRSGTRRSSVRTLVVLGVASFALLGQGERCRVDRRFISPSATLQTYWNALRAGDAETTWECFVEGRHDLPVPGMLWFLPPTDRLTLEEFRSLPVTGGRVMVSYAVRYRPTGSTEERVFRTGDELVRARGEWRIARPLGEASMPTWEATPQPVDI
jgi:hypothetical protein